MDHTGITMVIRVQHLVMEEGVTGLGMAYLLSS